MLQDLIQTERKAAARVIDDIHGLHGQTLDGSKRAMAMIDEGGGTFAAVLIGHKRLDNNLRATP